MSLEYTYSNELGKLWIYNNIVHEELRKGASALENPHVILLGISLGNGYFTKNRIELAIRAFANLSGSLAIIVPDSISVHTYRALGYTEKEAMAHVNKHSRHTKQLVEHSIELAAAESPEAKIVHLEWSRDVTTLSRFHLELAGLQCLIEECELFRHDVFRLSRTGLSNKLNERDITSLAVREAANYVLNELAFLRVCSSLLGSNIVAPYHKPFNLGADFCAGRYGKRIDGVAWAVYGIDF